MSFSPVCRDGDVIVWAADKYLFAYNQSTRAYVVDRNAFHEAAIRSISSRGGKWATGGDDKKVVSWSSSWEPTSFTAQKKVTAVLQLDDRILFADRYGDVYSLKDGEAKLLLGHLAIITQMILVCDNQFLVTADNDNKIRVSKYPDAYAIQSFCLGHTQFVSKLLPLADGFASLSADRTLRVWSLEGREQKCIPLRDAIPWDGVIEGDHCIVLYQDQETMQKINMLSGATESEPVIPCRAQAVLSETIYVTTTGRLESTREKFPVFSGDDIITPLVHFASEKDEDECGDENSKQKRRRMQKQSL